MKKILFCSLVALLSGCTSIRTINKQNIQKLSVGMTKSQVIEIMGEPLKDEVYHQENAWFYYTQRRAADFVITRDECTPLVFDELDLLQGWGRDFYRKNVTFQ